MKVTLRWHAFAELSGGEVYEILSLRQRVFILEQRCAYLDADGLDRFSLHLCGRSGDGLLVAYLRLLPPGTRFAGPSIGRVMTAPEVRHTGIGRTLMEEGIRRSLSTYPDSPLWVSAQSHLERFYGSLGFLRSGTPHDEDGIEHISMVRAAAAR